MHLTVLHGQVHFDDSHRPRSRGLTLSPAVLPPAVVLGLILLLTWLAVQHMGVALWYDEYKSLYNVGGGFMGPLSIGQILTRIATENAWQAPTYYLILAAWGQLVGWSEFATRALSLFFGLLAVGWIYRFGRAAFNVRVGVLAAIALGMSGFFVHFLHEMRAYTLIALLSIIMIDAYWRLVYRRGGWRNAVIFTVAVAALPYTHYFAVTAPFTLALYHLLFVPKNRRWLLVPGLMLVALLAFLPWLTVVLKAISMAGDDARRFQVLPLGELLRRMLMLFGNSSPALLLLFLAFSLVARRRATLMVWFLFIGGFIVMVSLDQFVHILVEVKYAMSLIPLMALAAAVGIDQLGKRGVPLWALAGLWIIAGFGSIASPAFEEQITPAIWRFPWQQAVASIAPHADEGDAALVLLPDPSLLSKNYEPVMKYYFHDLPIRPSVVAPSPETTDARYYDLAVDGAKDAARVWVLYDQTRRPWRDGPLESQILPQNGFADCGEVSALAPIRMKLFMHKPDDSSDDQVLTAAQYDGLTVYNGGFPESTSESSLPVALGFSSSFDSDDYSFGLHVVDSAGNLVAQKDDGLPTDDFACKAADIDLSNVGAGEYALKLVIYNWQTGERILDNDGDDRPTLGTFTVER